MGYLVNGLMSYIIGTGAVISGNAFYDGVKIFILSQKKDLEEEYQQMLLEKEASLRVREEKIGQRILG